MHALLLCEGTPDHQTPTSDAAATPARATSRWARCTGRTLNAAAGLAALLAQVRLLLMLLLAASAIFGLVLLLMEREKRRPQSKRRLVECRDMRSICCG